MQLVVVGSGLAGVSACLAARAGGASVSLVRGRAGASALSSGAWDLDGWQAPGGDRSPLPAAARELLEAARAPVVLEDALVVGSSGVLRPSRARDLRILGLPRALLDRTDSQRAPFGVVVVPRVPIATWDADAIASSLDDVLRAAGHAGARAVDATLVRHRDELRGTVADLARAHDDETRAAWLVERLRETVASSPGVAAIVLPPMLGIDEATIARVRAGLGVLVGEALGEPGGPAALRHARWTDRALRAAGVTLVDGEVTHVAEGAVQVKGGGARAVAAERVVLAAGGIDAGGLVFGTHEHHEGGIFPERPRPAIRLGLTIGGADVVPVLDGKPIDACSSLFGLEGDRFLLGRSPSLVRAGLSVDERGAVLDRLDAPVPWLFAAGALIAGAPRTALSAVVTGMRAGRSASMT